MTVEELTEAVRAYFKALDNQIQPWQWVNLKGAARKAAITKRGRDLDATTQRLRDMVKP